MSERKPSVGEAIGKAFESKMNNMFTAIPAIVLAVKNQGECRVDVQPAINMRDKDGEVEKSMPAILNVPVHMPYALKGGLTFPVSVGDNVLLVFSQNGIDTWKRGGGGVATPSNLRTFDAQDAIAITGTMPFQVSMNQPSKRSLGHNPNDLVLGFNLGGGNECEIRMDSGGNITVNSPNKVEVNCTTALVNSQDYTINTNSYTVNSDSVNFSSSSYSIGTNTYSMSATDSATSTGVMSHNGSFTLDGTEINSHSHGGVERGGSNTNPFGG